MKERTTIQIPRPLVEKLRRTGSKAQTYADIIGEALEALQARRLLDEQWQIYLDVKAGREPAYPLREI